ncbi:hypothetical protein BDZ89DRAFT_1020245 [Hymenopellis radicata]|nr:hypothetical protein BDZ89DRAFT_1020245 [Hymenopellis radicata]
MLPSVLPPQPAIQDASTTAEDLTAAQGLAKVTSPSETPLFLCTLPDCFRLFPNRDRIMAHRKRDHPSLPEEIDAKDANIMTWNE